MTNDRAGNITALRNDNDELIQYLYDGDGRICAVLAPPPFSGGPSTMIDYIYNAEGERVAKGYISNWRSW